MNDSQLIFEAYLNENRYRMKSVMMQGANVGHAYEREAATGTTGGKGILEMSPEEEARILDAKHSAKMNEDLKNGDVLDMTQILGDSKRKKMMDLISMMSGGSLKAKSQLNAYPEEGPGLIPKFKLRNIIELLNSFKVPEKKYNALFDELKTALIGIDDGTRPYYDSRPVRITPEGEKVTRHTGDVETFAQRFKGKEGTEGIQHAMQQVRERNPERGAEMATDMPTLPSAGREAQLKQRRGPILHTPQSEEPKGKTFEELKIAKGKEKKKVAKESFIRDDIAF